MILKKLRDFLPVSRRVYAKSIEETIIVLNGLIAADANHCQMEIGIIQEIQRIKAKNGNKKKPKDDVAFS